MQKFIILYITRTWIFTPSVTPGLHSAVLV